MVDRDLLLRKLADLDQYVAQVADRPLRVASTYAEIYDVLGEAGLLEDRLRTTMIRMARFRNILVHDYERIDPAVVIRILREDLDDFRRFREAVLGLI